MAEPIAVGFVINFMQLATLFIAAIFAALTAVLIVIVFLVGYFVFITYAYKVFSRGSVFDAGLQLLIMTALVLLATGILGGYQALVVSFTLFIVPAVLIFLAAIYSPLKVETEPFDVD